MEIIYKVKNEIYPFHKEKQTSCTQAEHLIPLTDEKSLGNIRQFAKKYKNTSSPHLMKLLKVLKEDETMHLLYQYFQTSLQSYISRQNYAEIRRLMNQVSCAFKSLETSSLKVQIRVDNMGVDQAGSLKIFVCPDQETTLSQEELQQFYLTEKTRIKLEIQQIWQKNQSQKQISDKEHKNPGFIISGNELIFEKNHKQVKQTKQELQVNNSEQTSNKEEKLSFNQTIKAEIQRQKDITQKLKQRRIYQKDNNEISEEQKITLPQHKLRKVAKKNSLDNEYAHKIQVHRNSSGSVNMFAQNNIHLLSSQVNQKNSSSQMAETEKVELPPIVKEDSSSIKEDLVPLKDQKEKNIHFEKNCQSAQNENQGEKEKIQQKQAKNEQEKNEKKEQKENDKQKKVNKDGSEMLVKNNQQKQEPKIQITTEMVSKYKMKIVTCQQIQFQGKEGDNIEQLAQQKLLEYQQLHRYQTTNPTLQYSTPSTKPESLHQKQDVGKMIEEVEQGKVEQQQKSSANIMAKIMQAKQKTSNVLKQYRNKKK